MERNALRAYRDSNGLTQAAVAIKLEVSRSLVAQLESGAKPFTADMAIRVEERLGIDRAELRPDLFKRRQPEQVPAGQ